MVRGVGLRTRPICGQQRIGTPRIVQEDALTLELDQSVHQRGSVRDPGSARATDLHRGERAAASHAATAGSNRKRAGQADAHLRDLSVTAGHRETVLGQGGVGCSKSGCDLIATHHQRRERRFKHSRYPYRGGGAVRGMEIGHRIHSAAGTMLRPFVLHQFWARVQGLADRLSIRGQWTISAVMRIAARFVLRPQPMEHEAVTLAGALRSVVLMRQTVGRRPGQRHQVVIELARHPIPRIRLIMMPRERHGAPEAKQRQNTPSSRSMPAA